MHNETALIVAWLAAPVVAYLGGRLAIGRTKQIRSRQPVTDPEGRLEELRRRMVAGERVPRGRMAEAVLLAESARTR